VELSGLEPRRSDLARGIIIARSAEPLDLAAQRAIWEALTAAGVTEKSESDEPEADPDAGPEDDPRTPRQWIAGPWLPPSATELEGQKLALEAVAERYGLSAIHLIKVETGIDGVAWMEMTTATRTDDDTDDEDEASPPGVEQEVVDAIFDEPAEVLYAAPDAPAMSREIPIAAESDLTAGPIEDTDEPGDDDDDDDDLEDDFSEEIEIDSHWRNGPPPLEHSVSFPIERYPEILEDYDWERFGVALKLSGAPLPGEESVINAFFALWLSVYQDERVDELEPFQRADVVHDRKHRSALMWVERFTVPATATDQVHFLLWIVARIHDVLPIAWARFDNVDDAVKARADASNGTDAFVLAGNPFAERFRRHGEEPALAWAVSQSAWSRRELAGMLIEVALEHDPDSRATAAVAERLLRRALIFDPHCDATGYLAIVLVRQNRLAEAIAIAAATTASSRDVRLLVIGEIAEHAPTELDASALALLDPETARATDPEELSDLVGSIARHAPAALTPILERLPDQSILVPYLYNASFAVERPQALAILRRVISLPEPPKGVGEARTALVMAWNNACIHAHALDDFNLAVELADGGQRFAPENPYIYHSAACAYAAVQQIDRALEQVAKAIEHDYEHTEKMETDSDLASLHADPRFSALFTEWRNRRADLN
jgi:tetratricopeptide (TPR) repeat protein